MSNSNPAVQALVDVAEKRAAEYNKAYEKVKTLRSNMRDAVRMAEAVAQTLNSEPPEFSESVRKALAARNKSGDNPNVPRPERGTPEHRDS